MIKAIPENRDPLGQKGIRVTPGLPVRRGYRASKAIPALLDHRVRPENKAPQDLPVRMVPTAQMVPPVPAYLLAARRGRCCQRWMALTTIRSGLTRQKAEEAAWTTSTSTKSF